jgi:hypothetical protein
MPCSPNVIIPLWFALFALGAAVLPHGPVFGSLFLLALGLTVPAMVYVVWQDPPRRPVMARQRGTASPPRPI